MANISYAKARARKKARQVYRTNIRKPKKAVVKKFANFVGKATFKTARKSRGRRMMRRGMMRRKFRRY